MSNRPRVYRNLKGQLLTASTGAKKEAAKDARRLKAVRDYTVLAKQQRHSGKVSLTNNANKCFWVIVMACCNCLECSIKVTANSESDVTNDPKILFDQAEHLTLEHWDIPPAVVRQYRRNGITKLFPWQAEALCASRGNPDHNYNYSHEHVAANPVDRTAFQGQSLVYQAPTSGGKSLVAEVLMLQKLLHCKQNVLFVLPYISLTMEKQQYLQKVWKHAPIAILSLFVADIFLPSHFQYIS